MKERNINIIGGVPLIKTLPETGYVNRGIIKINTETNNVIELKEILNISKKHNSELYNELASVNFIGLQMEILNKLKIILDDFKKEHKDNEKIECLLPESLNQLIKNKKIRIQFFRIQNNILGITNPGDEIILKKYIAEHNGHKLIS